MDTFATCKARCGAPRIAKEFNALGIPCSFYYVANVLLKHSVNADGPNQKSTTDITCIWVCDRRPYLARVIGLYSRSIVGCSLGFGLYQPDRG